MKQTALNKPSNWCVNFSVFPSYVIEKPKESWQVKIMW